MQNVHAWLARLAHLGGKNPAHLFGQAEFLFEELGSGMVWAVGQHVLNDGWVVCEQSPIAAGRRSSRPGLQTAPVYCFTNGNHSFLHILLFSFDGHSGKF